jgi:glycosyltransferase involved in cell wall biosynthesis
VWLHNRPDLAAAIRPIVHAAQAKLVLHMHNSFLARRSARRMREIQADRYVFVSRYLENEAIENVNDLPNTCVVYNGADRAVFYPREGAAANAVPTILLASRLVPEKGAHVFVEAMRELERRHVAAKGIIVGASNFGGSKDTPYVRKLHKDAPSNIEFHPYCSGTQLGDVFRTADIFCLPSIWQDPFPLAPLEAMACRLPVVATQSGGIPEAFRDGGAIIVPRNSVSDLADALQKLIEEPALRQSLADSGEASFQRNFTWSAVKDQYRSVIEATV